jgi:hypothetical protein
MLKDWPRRPSRASGVGPFVLEWIVEKLREAEPIRAARSRY